VSVSAPITAAVSGGDSIMYVHICRACLRVGHTFISCRHGKWNKITEVDFKMYMFSDALAELCRLAELNPLVCVCRS